MRNFLYNLTSVILTLLIIIVFCGTIYFCLDVFGIVQIPKEYSIASLFYSQIDVIVAGENLTENIVPEEILKDVFEEKLNIDYNDIPENPDETTEVVAPTWDVNEALETLAQIRHDKSQDIVIETLDPTTVEAERFYYDQLGDCGKIIYAKMDSEIDKLKTGTHTFEFGTTFNDLLREEGGSDVLNREFQLAINALTFDNPELFYIDVTKMYLLTEITTRAFSKTYRVSIGGNGKSYLSNSFESTIDVERALDNIQRIKDSIIIKEEQSDVEKIRNIHDYLVYTTEYDISAGENVYNIYGTLINQKAVCEGYARSCKYFLDEMGIPCIIVCGIGKNSSGETESHAWNYVKLQDQWYALDITWDDPVIIGGGSGNLSNDIRYAYFLKGSEDFFKDHYEDGNIVGDADFKYPQISVVDYE